MTAHENKTKQTTTSQEQPLSERSNLPHERRIRQLKCKQHRKRSHWRTNNNTVTGQPGKYGKQSPRSIVAPVGHGQQHKHRTTAQAQGSTSHHGQQHKHRVTQALKENKKHDGASKGNNRQNVVATWHQLVSGDVTDAGPHRLTIRPTQTYIQTPQTHRVIPTTDQPGK